MAIPILNHLDLRSVSELQNAILHKTTHSAASNVVGKLIYDTASNNIKYCTGTTNSDWVSLPGSTYTLPEAADGTLGGIQLGYSDSGQNYAVELDSQQAYVNVPWTDTNTQNTTVLSFVDSSDDIILRNTTGGAGSGTDDIKFVAGSNITLTHTDADNITIAATDTNTTYGTVSTSAAGLAPILPGTPGGKFLKADGTYAVPSYTTNTDTNTQNTTTLSFVDSSNDIILRNTISGASSSTDDIKFVAGSNITLTHTDADNITIASTDTNTTYSAASNSALGLVKLASDTDASDPESISNTSGRTYAVQLDENDQAVVNVPWSDTNTDTNTFRTVEVDTNGNGSANNTLTSSETLRFKKGSNISLSEADGVITIASTDTDTNTTTTADVKSALNASLGGAATIGDSSDTITLPGNLVVSGTQTIQNETIQVVENNTIQFEGSDPTSSYEVKLTSADATVSDKTITLPNLSGHVPLMATAVGGTISATPAEINILDGVTGVTAAELSYVGDVTSAIQAQLDGKAATDVVTAREYATSITAAVAANTEIEVTHSLGSRDVIVQIYALVADLTTSGTSIVNQYQEIMVDVNRKSTSKISFELNVALRALAGGTLRVLVTKIG